jgi:Beta-lactamase superfamily domain
MRVEWHGQSAFTLSGDGGTVFVDPFGEMEAAKARGLRFEYPPIEADAVDLLLVTHEHADHNAVEAIPGEPATLRSTAGTHESPIGEVVGVASEHDEAAGANAAPTRSSSSASTASASPTSATLGRLRCGPSRRPRSAPSTC